MVNTKSTDRKAKTMDNSTKQDKQGGAQSGDVRRHNQATGFVLVVATILFSITTRAVAMFILRGRVKERMSR